MGKLGEALEAGQMSTDSRAKIYNNMAHYHNTRGEYQAAITASLQALEAQPSFLRPYLRLAESHRLLGNPRTCQGLMHQPCINQDSSAWPWRLDR